MIEVTVHVPDPTPSTVTVTMTADEASKLAVLIDVSIVCTHRWVAENGMLKDFYRQLVQAVGRGHVKGI